MAPVVAGAAGAGNENAGLVVSATVEADDAVVGAKLKLEDGLAASGAVAAAAVDDAAEVAKLKGVLGASDAEPVIVVAVGGRAKPNPPFEGVADESEDG